MTFYEIMDFLFLLLRHTLQRAQIGPDVLYRIEHVVHESRMERHVLVVVADNPVAVARVFQHTSFGLAAAQAVRASAPHPVRQPAAKVFHQKVSFFSCHICTFLCSPYIPSGASRASPIPMSPR